MSNQFVYPSTTRSPSQGARRRPEAAAQGLMPPALREAVAQRLAAIFDLGEIQQLGIAGYGEALAGGALEVAITVEDCCEAAAEHLAAQLRAALEAGAELRYDLAGGADALRRWDEPRFGALADRYQRRRPQEPCDA